MAINIMGGVSGITVETDPTALKSANNLSDVPNKPTARSNLGLGTIATQPIGSFQQSTTAAYNLAFPFQSEFPHALKDGVWVPLVPDQTILYYDYSTSSQIDNTYNYDGYDSGGNYTSLVYGTTQVGSSDVVAHKADGNFTGNVTTDNVTVYEAGTGPTYGSGWGDSYIAYAYEYDSNGTHIGYIYVFHNGSGGFSYEQNPNNPPY